MNRNIYSSGSKGMFGQRTYDRGRTAPVSSRAVGDTAQDTRRVMKLAMAYVPDQRFENVYPASDALNAGTLFGDLNLPYCVGGRR